MQGTFDTGSSSCYASPAITSRQERMMESFLAANPFADSTKDERVKQHSAQKKAYVGAEEQRTKLASLKRNRKKDFLPQTYFQPWL
jgi:adenosyl cobinamide kinase/adenosyl cobinamide phosphate guanylyltransferase